jgi:hypothetical protein
MLVLLAGVFTGSLQAQTGGDGAITGTVTDSSGAVVAKATVTATDVATGVATSRPTTSSGSYAISPLTPGTYTVSVTAKGFKTYTQEEVVVDALASVGLNVTMSVGSDTETVVVTAAPPELDTTNATQGGTIENNVYSELPILMGGSAPAVGEQRDPTQFSNLLPGAQVPPGGRSSIINGTAQRLGELYVDGIPTTNATAQGDNRPVFNIVPFESIDQINVVTAGVPAEYMGAGMENYSLKSGTNTFHGAVFEYIRNTAFDSWNWASKGATAQELVGGVLTAVPAPKPAEHQDEYGVTGGGPVRIPHLFDGRDKLFFYGSYDRDTYYAGVNPQVASVPTTLMREGNFSELLTGNNTAGINYPIYDPTTHAACTANSTNGPCRYAYGQTYAGTPGKAGNPTGTITNIIPSGEISPQAQYMVKFLPQPNVPSSTAGKSLITSNYQGGTPAFFNNHLYSVRGDYDISDRQKLFGAYSWGKRINNSISGAQAPLPAPFNNGTDADVGGWFAEVEHSYTITSNLVNEFKAGFIRFYSLTQNLGLNNPIYGATAIGITGLPTGQASTNFPLASWSGTNAETAWGGGTTSTAIDDSYAFIDNLQWVKGKHAVTMGFQYQFLDDNTDSADGFSLPFTLGWSTNETGQPSPETTLGVPTTTFVGSTGYSFASYMLGAVSTSGVTEQPFTVLGARYHPFAPYFQDDYKITPKLTLNLGIRWDYLPTYTEVQNRWSFLNPNITNPITGNLGVLQTAGNFASGGVSCNCSTPVNTYWKNWGPRLGFAYSITSKLVARGGYGVLYTHGGGTSGSNASAYQGTGQTGFTSSSSPIADSQAGPAFYLNTGNSLFGGSGYSITPPAPISATTPDVNVGNFVCSGQAITQCSGTSGTFAGTGSGVAYADPYLGDRAPEIDVYNFGVEYEVSHDLTVSVNYVGSQSHFLLVSGARGLQSGQIDPKYLALTNVGGTTGAVGGSTGGKNYLTTTATAANVAAAQTASGITLPIPYPGYTAAAAATTNAPGVATKASSVTIQHMLTWMPQYSGTTDTWGDVGNASYNAVQASVSKRLTHGLSFTVNYTYSKNLDDAGTFRSGYAIPASATASGKAWAQDREDRALSVNDVPNLLTVFGVYKLPFGKGGIGGSNGFVRALAGGWELSSIYQYGSGLPLVITGSNDPAVGAVGQGTAMPDVNPNFHGSPRINGKWGSGLTSKAIGGVAYIMGYIPVTSAGAGFGSTPAVPKTSTTAAIPEVDVPCAASTGPFCNPGAGMIGDAPRVAPFGLRIDGQGRLAGHVGRTFDITERWKFVFGADCQNILNHVSFGNNAQNVSVGQSVTSATFGQITVASSDSRDFQFSGRLTF